MDFVLQIFLFILQLAIVEPARILAATPTIYPSHELFFKPIYQELINRGHEVVILTAFPTHENISNRKEIDLSFSRDFLPPPVRDSSIIFQIEQFYESYLAMVDMQFASKPVQDIIHNSSEHFDLVISELLSLPMFAFKARFNCPIVFISTMEALDWYHAADGNPIHALLYTYLRVISKEMNFQQRLMAFIGNIVGLTLKDYSGQETQIVRKYFGDDYPTSAELHADFDLLLSNTNVFIHNIRPMSPAFIQIGGGLHIQEPQDLPKDLQSYLDNSKHGVIYFSLGTYVSNETLTQKDLDMFIEIFAGLKYDVIWKYPQSESLKNKSDNVRVEYWVPQQDLLRHKNIKLFITQGGLHSLTEAILFKVPTIIVPFVADQPSNAERMHDNKLGVRIYFSDITPSKMKLLIESVIHDQTIQNNLEKAASILQDTPMKPLDTAIWWIEYVLRHKGAKHLRSKTLPFIKFYYLDIIIFLLAVFAIFSFVVCKATISVKRYLIINNTHKKQQ